VAKSAKDGAKRLLGISSPSKVFMEIGQQTGQGLAIGLEGQRRQVSIATGRMTSGLTSFTPPETKRIGVAGEMVAASTSRQMAAAPSVSSTGEATPGLTEAGVERAMTAAVSQLQVSTNINGRDFQGVIQKTQRDRRGR